MAAYEPIITFKTELTEAATTEQSEFKHSQFFSEESERVGENQNQENVIPNNKSMTMYENPPCEVYQNACAYPLDNVHSELQQGNSQQQQHTTLLSNVGQNVLSASSTLKRPRPRRVAGKNQEFNCNICGTTFPNMKRMLAHHRVCDLKNRINKELEANEYSSRQTTLCAEELPSNPAQLSFHRQDQGPSSAQTDTAIQPSNLNSNGIVPSPQSPAISSDTLVSKVTASVRENNEQDTLSLDDAGGETSQSRSSAGIASETSLPLPKGPLLSDGLQQCQICGKSYRTINGLEQHMVVHREKRFTCLNCGKQFHRKNQLIIHTRVHSGERPYKCHLCTKGFKISQALKHHIEMHNRGEKSFSCDTCGKKFAFEKSLKSHQRSAHLGEKPFQCDRCGKTFAEAAHLAVHKPIHDKLFQCASCDKSFARKDQLELHKRAHEGSFLYTCSFCPKGFNLKNCFEIHLRVHTGEKPFSCNQCNKGFASKQRLKDHNCSVKPNRFLCDLCGKGLASTLSLKRHLLIHTGELPYQCTDCSDKFRSCSGLKSHMLTHTGTKAFACKWCGKAFRQSHHVKEHETTHTGEREFKCEICGKDFKTFGNMRTHLKNTHKKRMTRAASTETDES